MIDNSGWVELGVRGKLGNLQACFTLQIIYLVKSLPYISLQGTIFYGMKGTVLFIKLSSLLCYLGDVSVFVIVNIIQQL